MGYQNVFLFVPKHFVILPGCGCDHFCCDPRSLLQQSQEAHRPPIAGIKNGLVFKIHLEKYIKQFLDQCI